MRHGERVVRSLLAHRELWEAALLDRDSVHNRRLLPAMGLIKLRDLDQNFWNADTLWILSPNVDSARRLQRLHDEDQWCGDEFHIFDNPEDVDNALGGAEDEQVLVRVWWD